jgi:hypothetical protein
VVVVCGAVVRRLDGRISPELSGALVDLEHLSAAQQVWLCPTFISRFKHSLAVFYFDFVRFFKVYGFVKTPRIVMPVPDHGRDDGSGIQNSLNLLDSGYRIESGTCLAGMTAKRKN